MPVPTIFTKPFDELNDIDVETLIGWPESAQVEFKGDIPAKGDKRDPWHDGKEFGEYGRDRLFREIVAFANTLGGHLVLGIEDSKDNPPTATSVKPIPRCDELADRLSRSAQAIDPPIRGMLIRGVQTLADGSGVVVFRVPESAAAPHRAPDLHAYIRRNTESVPMSMREIQDVALATRRRGDWLQSRFLDASNRFRTSFGGAPNRQPRVGYRITAVPIIQLSLPRLFGRHDTVDAENDYYITVNQKKWKVSGGQLIQARAIMRGVEHFFANSNKGVVCRVFQDGSIEFEHGTASADALYIDWIIANLIRVTKTADAIRIIGGFPDLEYSFEVELLKDGDSQTPLTIASWSDFVDNKWQLTSAQLKLPMLSYVSKTEIDALLTQVHTDIFDACGMNRIDPIRICVQ